MKQRRNYVTALLLICLFVSACGSQTGGKAPAGKTPSVKMADLLDTQIKITVYGARADEIAEGAIALCADYENLLSKTIEGSDIYAVNHAGSAFVPVSPETVGLLRKSIAYSQLSSGLFDVTIGAAVDCWDFSVTNRNPKLPDNDTLALALSSVDYTQIEFDGDNVRLQRTGAAIDLGAIAKGYIADRLGDYILAEGAEGAIISLGGNILTVGQKPDGNPWIVGIQKPFTETGEIIAKLSVGEKSVVSSGIYERYFVLDGKLYHHILDPETGYPMPSDMVAVTIVSDLSVDGDALSTVVFCLGREKGLALIDSLPGIEAAVVTEDHQIYYSKGFGVDFPVELLDSSYTVIKPEL